MEALILTIVALIGFLFMVGLILKFVFKKSLGEIIDRLIQHLIP